MVSLVLVLRNVAESIKLLLKSGFENELFNIRVQAFSIPDEEAMKAYRAELLRQLGTTPKYNEPDNQSLNNALRLGIYDLIPDTTTVSTDVQMKPKRNVRFYTK